MIKTSILNSNCNKENSWVSKNKSFITNFIAVTCIISGYFIPLHGLILKSVGYFALSGAITNWLAIYMLFEKISFIYGSGVIPSRFKEFKIGIKHLIINQFFTRKNINRFIKKFDTAPDIEKQISTVDFEKISQNLIESIMNSPFGNMFKMFAGKDALIPLKISIIEKLKLMFSDIKSELLLDNNHSTNMTEYLYKQTNHIIDDRLTEITPEIVRKIIHEMIYKHLGWLVVWGGIFGGMIGACVTLLD